jgi:hypothetical protein
VLHNLYSLRFDAYTDEGQIAGLVRLRQLASNTPATEAIIAAGDYNCPPP